MIGPTIGFANQCVLLFLGCLSSLIHLTLVDDGSINPSCVAIYCFDFRWFAKRFLHPDVVSIYDHIFLWDEDLGVENFHPRR